MIWAAILHSSIWLGYEIVGALAPDVWDVFDLFAAGCPTGIALSNWFFYFYRRIHELDQFYFLYLCIYLLLLSIRSLELKGELGNSELLLFVFLQ